MKIKRHDLFSAGKQVGLTQEQSEKLWEELIINDTQNSFGMSKLLFYLGTFLVILAMSWFMGEAWEKLGGQGIFWVALIYMLAFLRFGTKLWQKESFKTPGGLFITLAVCMIPLIIYGLQKWLGFWISDYPGQYRNFFSWIKGGWFLMELATILGGFILLYFYRFSFLTLPIFFYPLVYVDGYYSPYFQQSRKYRRYQKICFYSIWNRNINYCLYHRL